VSNLAMRSPESAHLSTENEPNARRTAIEPSVAIIVLHFNTPELTDGLAGYLREELAYPRSRVYVVDNGSAMSCRTATHHFPVNLGFTRGMYEAFQIARGDEPWDAYWFLNSDVGFEHGNCVLRELVRVLFSNERHGQIAPQHNSPHRFMERAYAETQAVPYLEPIATLIKASTIDRVGFWELELTHGWGVDYDYGHRVRAHGLRNVLTNRARGTHKQHRSIADFGAFVAAAQAEMHAVLSRKYGTDWGRITSLDGPIVPVILTCDREPSTFPDFVESFETLRDTVSPPVVTVDISASCRLSRAHIALVGQLAPRSVFVHSRLPARRNTTPSRTARASRFSVLCRKPSHARISCSSKTMCYFLHTSRRRCGPLRATRASPFLRFICRKWDSAAIRFRVSGFTERSVFSFLAAPWSC
jgi:GT2 family glycosyltransferase